MAYVEITRIVNTAQTSLLENVPSHTAQRETRRAYQNMCHIFVNMQQIRFF